VILGLMVGGLSNLSVRYLVIAAKVEDEGNPKLLGDFLPKLLETIGFAYYSPKD
jgi:hypothetical protein